VPIGLTVAAVLVVALAALALQAGRPFPGGPPSSPEPSSAGSEAPTASDVGAISGLPPAGSTPSDPTAGELALRFEGSVSAPYTTTWVYADGRLITHQYPNDRPPGVGEEFIGLVERRLTPAGVEFLRSQILATGLFDEDLTVAMEERSGFIELQVKNEDRLVRAVWAHNVDSSAPAATDEQVRLLMELSGLLTDQESWPASVWGDDTVTAYVPSHFAICLGVRAQGAAEGDWLGPTDPAPVWALFPQPAQDLLRAGEPTIDIEWMHADAGCTRLTTADARALAQAFEAAGAQRDPRQSGEYHVAYSVNDPTGTWEPIWIQFGPVLSHGVATWLGPG
jgi:hypothetical protein